jgi:hypothetical protein
MERNVGQELLRHLQMIDSMVRDVSDEKLKFNMGSVWIGTGSAFDLPYEEVEPIKQSLLDAGFVLKDKESRKYDVRESYRHPSLSEFVTVSIDYQASKHDELEGLLKEEAKLQERIEKLMKEVAL